MAQSSAQVSRSLPLFHSMTDMNTHMIKPLCVYFISVIDYKLSCDIPQDIFDVFPGDTDYRMFAEDYGDIPGLDIIFLLGGYYYHTSFDTIDRIM